MQPSLNDLQTWARQAGEILRAGVGQGFHVEHKGRIDLVTEIDKRSEAYLVQQIRARFSDHSIVTEETGLHQGRDDHRWFIDPLDGTINYVHGLPIYAVSIAYAYRGQMQLGVVYDPSRDECFSAERGQGAWLNGNALHVSDTNELIQALLVTGFSYDVDAQIHNLDYYGRFSTRAQAVRRLGSAALDLCYVAAGRLDGYWEMGVNSYDVAAGILLVQEAGGVVTSFSGNLDVLTPPLQIVAANPKLHPRLLEVIQEDLAVLKK